MSPVNGEHAVRGRERIKRWLRIHIFHKQQRDLFYPSCPQGQGPFLAAKIQFTGPRKVPETVFINGKETRLADAYQSRGIVSAELVRPELVLPGENVVSLPIDCDPRAIQIVPSPTPSPNGSRIGWGSQTGARILTEDPHLYAAASFLVNSLSPDIFGDGLVSLTVWDPAACCVRLWSWYWTTAIVYEALANLIAKGSLDLDLAPLELGLAARQFTKDEETRGSYMVRWDPDRTVDSGIIPWHAPNDAAYLGLHGLLVAHRSTGKAEWLERAVLVANWIVQRGSLDGRLRVGWSGQGRGWDDEWMYIDAAWTPAFFLELAARTGQQHWARHAEIFARDTVDRFTTDGPFYLKIWRANGRHTRTIFSRGMAWVLEGWLPLLAAGCDWLRPRTLKLLEGLVEHQSEDGSWPYLLDRPHSGSCNKGTPALAYHLNRARPLFPELAEGLDMAVVKALAWCENHMDMDPDSPSCGGIIAANSEGAISTVREIPTAINYGSAYYILTRQERCS